MTFIPTEYKNCCLQTSICPLGGEKLICQPTCQSAFEERRQPINKEPHGSAYHLSVKLSRERKNGSATCGIATMYYQDAAAVYCAMSYSYIVSVILDGGQYRRTDLPRMFLTGSGPLQKQHMSFCCRNWG